MRNPRLAPDRAPYRVEFRRKLPWKEAQDHMLWLVAQENPTEGFFNNGRKVERIKTPGGQMVVEDVVWYNFTDQNTAFLFKLHFG
jgi:hypothetical protein